MKLPLLLALLLPAWTRAQETPGPTNLTTETVSCQNGSAGSLFLSEVAGSVTMTASFGRVESCDSTNSYSVVAMGACSVALRAPAATVAGPTSTPSTTTPIIYSYDAGPAIVVRGANREVKLNRLISGPYTSYLFQEFVRFNPVNPTPANAFVRNGHFKILAEGGRDIKQFEGDFDLQLLLQMTKPANSSSASGQAAPTFEWTGGESINTPMDVRASVTGTTADNRQTYDIICRIPDGRSGTFTIPAATWTAVPGAIRSAGLASFSIIPYSATAPPTATVSVPELEKGLRIDAFQAVRASVILTP